VLEKIRTLIRAAAPGATETISYAIPTFDLNGKHLVHFAGYARHIGFYPTGAGSRLSRKNSSRTRAEGLGAVSIDQPCHGPDPPHRRIQS